ncbi:ATP-binding cassette domain-containing protein [Paenibacillus mesophilus]|uniref:ATP-binding cassette domain-containing protein n=1 Tax=Paenibacillus mesophilus TaxID=2582849 RepID=UPI00110DB6D3|nr:ATP-binding cassette domain-containing protein [Paenibacillus mesophilus]
MPANRSIGIIGKCGSGKSTVAKRLFRSCEAQHGTVAINGCDVRHMDPVSLRTNIAYIPNTVELFEGTLRDNVSMFDRAVPMTGYGKRYTCCVRANGCCGFLSGWINSLTETAATTRWLLA